MPTLVMSRSNVTSRLSCCVALRGLCRASLCPSLSSTYMPRLPASCLFTRSCNLSCPVWLAVGDSALTRCVFMLDCRGAAGWTCSFAFTCLCARASSVICPQRYGSQLGPPVERKSHIISETKVQRMTLNLWSESSSVPDLMAWLTPLTLAGAPNLSNVPVTLCPPSVCRLCPPCRCRPCLRLWETTCTASVEGQRSGSSCTTTQDVAGSIS